ncbi:unnamed protein product [Spodoptera exigua]|nr:unnamed protein product [Spodoptera exigua]
MFCLLGTSTAKCSGGSPHRERRRRDDDATTPGGFSAALHRTPPPPPPALLRRLGVKEPTGVGKSRAGGSVRHLLTKAQFLLLLWAEATIAGKRNALRIRAKCLVLLISVL